MTRRVELLVVAAIFLSPAISLAELPNLTLGPKPSFGLFQPRVTVEVFSEEGGENFGPTASTFLLDTAANGIVIFPPATEQLGANGFQNEGAYEEAGVSGTSVFDVSAPYHLAYVGTDGRSQSLDDVRFMSGASPVDPTGLMGLNGIVGMAGMVGKVTSLDNRTREGAPTLGMGLSFSDLIPASSTQRFTIPFDRATFSLEGEEGPFPTWSEALPSVMLNSTHADNSVTNSIVFDTGAQTTIISEAMANSLGLDANGNGDFSDEAIATAPITGATGSVDAPILVVDRMSLPTAQGFELTWTNAEVIVLDIDPSITGVIGSDFITGDGGLDFSLLGGGGLGGLGDLLGGGDLGGLLGDLFGGGGLGGLGDLLGGGGLGDLLGDLLGGGGLGDLGGLLGGGSDLFASFPLESYFDQVHIDLRDFQDGGGQLVLDVNPEISAGILNGDGLFDAADIDDLTAAIDSSDGRFDLDDDGLVSVGDRDALIHDVFGTRPGDADLDKDVDFSDFLNLADNFDASKGWAGGDFDGDGTTGFSDFLLLSANFGNATPTASVPEPTSWCLAFVAVGGTGFCRRRRG